MKISHSASYFLLILVSIALVLLFFNNKSKTTDKILLQTLDCQSDKLDRSILDLNAKTSMIGAYISFKTLPLTEAERAKLNKYKIIIDEKSWIFDYAQAQIPTQSLCPLIQEANVQRVFIPQFN